MEVAIESGVVNLGDCRWRMEKRLPVPSFAVELFRTFAERGPLGETSGEPGGAGFIGIGVGRVDFMKCHGALPAGKTA